jgi:ferric-dicitrate binding protein FerR (iron transport regulator)
LSERDIIVEEAARWSERMSRPVLDSTEAAEFDAWMNADARHRDAFARLQTLWHSDALQQSLADVIGEQADEPPAPSPRFRWRWPVGASAAAAAMVGAFLLAWPATLQNYRTTIGHNAHVMLADGSTVDLGGDAELKVRILPWSRTATLVRGEAFFDVRHEATRRFTLASGDAAIRVLGTAFNVDRQGDRRTVVQVYRGAVELSGPSGERAILRRGTAGAPDRQPDRTRGRSAEPRSRLDERLVRCIRRAAAGAGRQAQPRSTLPHCQRRCGRDAPADHRPFQGFRRAVGPGGDGDALWAPCRPQRRCHGAAPDPKCCK